MLPWELIALHHSFWAFMGGDYLFKISLFGESFPIEEFFAWMIFAASSVLSLSEVGIGKEKINNKNYG